MVTLGSYLAYYLSLLAFTTMSLLSVFFIQYNDLAPFLSLTNFNCLIEIDSNYPSEEVVQNPQHTHYK